MAQIAAQKCEFSCDEVAVLYCKGCEQFLCVECRQNVHDRVRKFQDHEVVDIHREGNRVRPNPVCETHKNQFLYYCSKCECLTCAECMTSSHNEHKTEKIKTVADARRQNVNKIIEQLKTKVEIVKKKLETIDTEYSIQIKSDCESYVKTVEETVDDLHTIVDRHKIIPMTTASDFKDIENEDLGRKRAFFRSRHDETADRLLKFENLLQETHDSTFLTEWKILQTDVQMNDEETDDPLIAPRRIESFNQKKLTRSVIDEIDEKFQMRLREQEQTVVRLTEGMDALKDQLKEKQVQIDDLAKLSRELKEMKTKVTELVDENDKLDTEIKERKLQELSKLQEHEKILSKLEEDKTKLKDEMKVKQDEIRKLSKLLQGLKEKEKMVTGLQDENYKLTTEFKQSEMKAFSQLREKEQKVNELLEENDKLKSNIKIKQDELEKMSNEVDTKADLTNKLIKHFEDKIKDLENKWKQGEKKNTAHNRTDIFGVPKEVCCKEYGKAVEDFIRENGNKTCLKENHFIDKDAGLISMIQKEISQKFIPISSSNKGSSNSGGLNAGGQGRYTRSLSSPEDPDASKKESLNRNDNFAGSMSKFQKQFIAIKDLKVIVVQDDIINRKVYTIVCPQDENISNKGDIARAIEKVCDDSYKRAVKDLVWVSKGEIREVKASPSSLPFQYVLQSVPPRYDKFAEANRLSFDKDLEKTIRNIFRHCRDKGDVTSVAMPVLGIGKDGLETPVLVFAKCFLIVLLGEIKSAQKFDVKEIHIVTNDTSAAVIIADELGKEKSFNQVTFFSRTRNRGDKEIKQDTKMVIAGKSFRGKLEDGSENCIICTEPNIKPHELTCGHIFCKNCVQEFFKVKPVCPTCGSIQVVIKGDQPAGTMKRRETRYSLPGYTECGTIEIEYEIYGGVQGEEHPNPGRSFKGIKRVAYFPNNTKGKLIADLLKIAFDRKLVFTIGHSRTTGQEGVVTWNDIHHKTSSSYGHQFGYPDEGYFDRVLDELKIKGVTEKDLKY